MRNKLLALGSSFLVLLILACSPGGGPNEIGTGGLTVALVGIDTLRADFLSCYGFPHPITPRIDQIAEEGVLFENAVATAPWTLPSFASLLTGYYPSTHGAGKRTGEQRAGGEPPKSPLRRNIPLLQEILRDEGGFKSALFYDNPYLEERWGISRGFNAVMRSREGGLLSVRRALRWLRERPRANNFVFLHLMEPHLPYDPPEPYRSIASNWLLGHADAGTSGTKPMPKGAKMRALYGGEVAYTDFLVGKFVDGLRELGILERSLLIVVSDHGEEFYEHEEVERQTYNDPREIWGIGHGHSQFQELIAIPLIIRFPGRIAPGTKVETLAQIHDLPPSILEWLGIDVPRSMAGESLIPAVGGRGGRRYAFSEYILYGDDRRSYREGKWKLIQGDDVTTAELYDLGADPGETTNLGPERPELLRRLSRRLSAVEREAVAHGDQIGAEGEGAVVIDEAMREELRALGYIQ